ncbi:ABC transporter substrate-binding protein [Methanoregula sp.]|jgi:ABC-type nitrate/sulfonate/bicarbonate transport system substrate-binding protein|uniref:ABC transporter substrate-binding protein n=1 Tax=Methanoregula sp. TaxID=2052170 RepID=UPI003C258DD6
MAQKRKNQIVLAAAVALIIVLLLVIAGCTQSSSSGNANTDPSGSPGAISTISSAVSSAAGSALYTIRANVNKDCSGTPWYVGVQKGYFVHGGINFVDSGALDWSLQPAALIAGQTDVVDEHPNTLIDLLLAGAHVHGVALSGQEPPSGEISEYHMHWLVLNSSPYQTIKDLVASGHKPKIAVGALGICADLENNNWFRENNLTNSSFEYVIMPDPQQEAALRSGQIDVAVLHPPFYTAAEKHGGVRIITTSYDAFGPQAGTSLLAFTDDFIKNHPDSVRAFINAYKNSERWSDNHLTESGILTANTIGLANATPHYYSQSGAITDDDIQPWIDAMVKDGDIVPGQFKPSDLYTTEFSDTWVNETAVNGPDPVDPFPSLEKGP